MILLKKRNKRHYLWLLPLMLPFSFATFAMTPKQISFSEAVSLALKSNPRIGVSRAKVEAASAQVLEARGSGLPKVNMEVGGSRSNNPLTVFASKLSQGSVTFNDFGASQFTGPSSLNVKPIALNSPGYYTNWNTAVVVTIPLFSGGQSLAKVAKSQSLLNAAQRGDQSARIELTYDVLQAYEGVHVTEKLVAIAKKALVAATDYIKLTKDLHKQSVVIESDVLLAENYYRSVRVTLEAAVNEKSNQLEAFQLMIGKDRYVPGKHIQLAIPDKSITYLQNRAHLTNAQLQSLKSMVEASRSDMDTARASYWPQLNLQLRHDWNAPALSLSGESNTAMLEMNWQLFSSGEQYGATKQAAAQFEQAQAEMDNAANNIQLQVGQALRAIKTAEIQLNVSVVNANKSIEIIRELKRRYGQGLIPLGQLLDAQSRYDTACAQQVMAGYSLLLAKAKLLALTNELNTATESAA